MTLDILTCGFRTVPARIGLSLILPPCSAVPESFAGFKYQLLLQPYSISTVELGTHIFKMIDFAYWRFESPQGLGIFLFTTASRPALGTHPASYPMGARGSFPGSKAAGA
jgi:hypothetical protein